jgi:hypothetical protein
MEDNDQTNDESRFDRNESRLDRLDDVQRRMIQDYEGFRVLHERLQAGALEMKELDQKLEKSLASIDEKLDRLKRWKFNHA